MFTVQGEIEWRGGADGPILLHDFLTDDVTEVKPDLVAPPARTRQHGGADFFLVNSFTKAVARQVIAKIFQYSDCKNISPRTRASSGPAPRPAWPPT